MPGARGDEISMGSEYRAITWWFAHGGPSAAKAGLQIARNGTAEAVPSRPQDCNAIRMESVMYDCSVNKNADSKKAALAGGSV
jgi:hypothetical protein